MELSEEGNDKDNNDALLLEIQKELQSLQNISDDNIQIAIDSSDDDSIFLKQTIITHHVNSSEHNESTLLQIKNHASGNCYTILTFEAFSSKLMYKMHLVCWTEF